MRNLSLFFFSLLFISCEQEIIPKPKAYLSLEYPKKTYQKLPISRPYTFEVLESSVLKDEQKSWLKITYPALKASIDITYREVDANVLELVKEAEKLVFKHTLKQKKLLLKIF